MNPLEVVGAVLLLVGAAVFVVGAIGLLRLPDALARLMPITLVGTVGVLLILSGVWCFHPGWWAAVKVAAIGILLPLTSSAGASALARAAYMRGPVMEPAFDHLAEHQRAERSTRQQNGDEPDEVAEPGG